MFSAPTLLHYLVLGAILFAISIVGIFLNRRNVIILLMAIELMLLAVNMNFIAFSSFRDDMAGPLGREFPDGRSVSHSDRDRQDGSTIISRQTKHDGGIRKRSASFWRTLGLMLRLPLTMSESVFICSWRFDSSRERKHCATP